MLTKDDYIEILKERNRRKKFAGRVIDLVKEFLIEAGKIALHELIKTMLSYNEDIKTHWIRESVFILILEEKVDFEIIKDCLTRPMIRVWLASKEIAQIVEEETAPAPAEEPAEPVEERPDNFPVFLSPSVRESAQEQISRLRCFLLADENNKNAAKTNMVISITEGKQLTLTFQADSFQSMETFISLITHKSWRDE